MNHADLVGQRFGWLVVIEDMGMNGRYQKKWLCECGCGKRTAVRGDFLQNGNTKSCGCMKRLMASERMSNRTGSWRDRARAHKAIGT